MNYKDLKKRVNKAEVPPKGFKTAADWGKQWNKTTCTALLMIRQAKAQGLVEEKTFRIQRGAQGIAPVRHIRFL